MRSALAVLIVAGLAGCAYHPGSFAFPGGSFAGAHATVDCLDVAVTQRAPTDDDEPAMILQLAIGNRCAQPQVIDLAHVHVVGRVADGRELALRAVDPDRELQPLPLDGRSYAAETIAYRTPAGEPLASACLDVATIVHADAPRWVCVPNDVPAEEPPDHCRPADDYVGHRACNTRFGVWSLPARLPPMFLDFGLEGRDVQLHSAGGALAPAFTTSFRAGVGVGHGFYVGLEGEVGGVGGAAERANEPGLPDAQAATFLGGYGLVGVRGALGPVGLSTELAGGARIVLGDDTPYEGQTIQGISDGAYVVEARVRAQLWLNPWIAVGATAGTSLTERGDMIGGFLSVSTRAFGGDRR